MFKPRRKFYLWTDFETTGSDPNDDLPLEGFFLLTDDKLNEISRKHIFYKWSQKMSEIKDWCTEDAFKMHTDNGLFDDLEKAPTLSFDDAEQQLRQFLKTWLPINEDCIIDLHLAGATLFLDRTIIERYHPYLVGTLRHRTLDVSSVALALGLDFEASSFSGLSPKRPHRAEADVLESISRYKAIKAMVGELNKDVSSLNSFKALNFPVN